MKNYWKYYTVVLLAYIVFGIVWISFVGNMIPALKIIITGLCAISLTIVGIGGLEGKNISRWKFIYAVPISIFIWALMVDALTGLYFHEGIFYLGNSWPDYLIKMPGELYFILKGCGCIVFTPLLKYIR